MIVLQTVYCPLCNSSSPESQARLREVASYGMARFMHLALKAGVSVTPEQQADIFDALLTWEPYDAPAEVAFMVHEHAMRALIYAGLESVDDDRLEVAAAKAPAWNANWDAPGTFNTTAEVRIGERIAATVGTAIIDESLCEFEKVEGTA